MKRAQEHSVPRDEQDTRNVRAVADAISQARPGKFSKVSRTINLLK